MKTRLILTVQLDCIKSVVKTLREKGITEIEVLDTIGILTIAPKNLKISEIKKIEGVESVEKEQEAGIEIKNSLIMNCCRIFLRQFFVIFLSKDLVL